jgi:hypothetical protein
LPYISEIYTLHFLSILSLTLHQVNPPCDDVLPSQSGALDRPRYETSVDESPCQHCSPRHRRMGSGIDVVLVGAIAAWGHVSERPLQWSAETMYQGKSLDPCRGPRGCRFRRRSHRKNGLDALVDLLLAWLVSASKTPGQQGAGAGIRT